MTWFRGAGQKTMGVALVHEKHPHPRGWNSRVSDKLSSYLPPFSFFSSSFLSSFFLFLFLRHSFFRKWTPPSSFLERPFMFQKASLCLFAWKRESMVIIFLYLRFSRLGVAFRTEQGVGNLFRKIGLRFENIEKGWKIFLPKIWILETPPCGRNCFRPRN